MAVGHAKAMEIVEVKIVSQGTILIIGGGGKTGARVHTRLRARGIATRPVSRSTETPFDWERPEGWAAAFDGIARAYVTYQPDLAVEGAAEAIAKLAAIARGSGLERMVLLSGRGEPGAQRAEAELQASGVPWTIVRASWFNQNFSEGYLLDGVLAGKIALPAGPVPEPFIETTQNNEDVEVVQELLRHANSRITLDLYMQQFAENNLPTVRNTVPPTPYHRFCAVILTCALSDARAATWLAIASPRSLVLAWPPRSGVRISEDDKIAVIAFSIPSAASACPK